MTSIGETQSESFVGRNGDEFTATTTYINGVATPWTPSFTALGGDFFRYSYTPLVPGFYEWAGTGSISGELTINFEVEPALGIDEAEAVSETFIGQSGEVYTRENSYINGVATTWDPVITDIGDDFFRYTYTPTVSGFYEWSGNGSLSGPITINFEVEPSDFVAHTPPVVLPGAVAGAVSLDDLVEHVALRSMDLVQAVATEGAVTATNFTDVNALIEDNQFYAGMEIHFRDGVNAGQTRRISASDYSSGTLSWQQPLPFPVSIGTKANLYNRSGLGHLYREYANALNMVILEVGGNVMSRVTLEVATLPTFGSPTISLDPTQIAKVCRFDYQDLTGARPTIRRNRHNGWWAENGSTTVTFNGGSLGAVSMSRSPLRAYGYQRSKQLIAGTDTTTIDAEWLVETAAGLLQNANPDNAGNLGPGQYLRNRADAMRGKMATPFDANCVRVG